MDGPRIRIILASHGEQSKGMLNTVQMLLGEQENIAAYSLYPHQTPADLTEALRKEVEQYGAENILFMTELKQGSPFNAVVELTRDYDLHHITGINLPALMTAIMERDDDVSLDDLCDTIMEDSQNTIWDVRKLLAASGDDDEEEDL